VSAAELATFVREHFFKDPQLARQHPGSGKAYWAALARLVLKRFLLLAALLDRAAQLPALPSAAPLLFRRDSKLKTSVQVGFCEVTPYRVVGSLPSAGLGWADPQPLIFSTFATRCSPSLRCRGWRARATWCARWAAWATSCRTCRTHAGSWTLRVRAGDGGVLPCKRCTVHGGIANAELAGIRLPFQCSQPHPPWSPCCCSVKHGH